jgi:phage tail sheath protein FI
MPVTPTYPGIYIQEAQSSSHTIVAASTNVAVFIGYTHPLKTSSLKVGVPTEIFGFSDYQRNFGGFVSSSAFTANRGVVGDMAVAVNQFFLNGGTDAFVVSVNSPTILGPGPSFTLAGYKCSALEVTDELYSLTVEVSPQAAPVAPTSPPSSPPASSDPLADIKVTYGPSSTSHSGSSPPSGGASATNGPAPSLSGAGVVVEVYRRVSLATNGLDANGNPKNPNHILNKLAASSLVSLAGPASGAPAWPSGQTTYTFAIFLNKATPFYNPTDFTNVMEEDTQLDKLSSIFNLMVIPGVADNSVSPGGGQGDASGALILSTAMAFCERKRAFLVVDPPTAASADGSKDGNTATIAIADAISASARSKNAALYFPYLLTPDPRTGSSTNPVTGLANEMPPAATVAGVYASTDLARGVWKAPAGFQAITNNVTGVTNRGKMTDPRQGTLNPIGVNCLREFPNVPVIVFGARTMATTFDQQWTYVSVRRMALFLEQSLYASLKWVVFEPNAEPLWSAITMSINAFMLGLFKQGAFQGTTPSQAFRVQCDDQTTSQSDIDSGIVNIVVSFAPLKPAEFVVITIAQLAGQSQT